MTATALTPFCVACRAIPRAGQCNLSGCPMGPQAGQVAFSPRPALSPGQVARVVDASPIGSQPAAMKPHGAKPVPFKAGQLVTIERLTPLGMFAAVGGAPGLWRADRFQPQEIKGDPANG